MSTLRLVIVNSNNNASYRIRKQIACQRVQSLWSFRVIGDDNIRQFACTISIFGDTGCTSLAHVT